MGHEDYGCETQPYRVSADAGESRSIRDIVCGCKRSLLKREARQQLQGLFPGDCLDCLLKGTRGASNVDERRIVTTQAGF